MGKLPSVLGNVARKALPMIGNIAKKALPMVKDIGKEAGKSALSSGVQVIGDMLAGKPAKASVEQHGKILGKRVLDHAANAVAVKVATPPKKKIRKTGSGSPIKSSASKKKLRRSGKGKKSGPTKRGKDIFDQ